MGSADNSSIIKGNKVDVYKLVGWGLYEGGGCGSSLTVKLESESSAERMCERKKRDDWFMEEV